TVVRARGTLVTVRAIRAAKAGRYTVTVAAASGTEGGFDLATSGRYPTRYGGAASIDVADAQAGAPFPALAGDLATIVARRARRSLVVPSVIRFDDAGGAATDLPGGPRQSATTATTGDHRFVVTGANSTTGAFTYVVGLRRLPASRA